MSHAAPASKQGSASDYVPQYTQYILGPGDTIFIELLNIPELSGTFTIGPDGIIYLPRIRALFVEGLTIEELSSFLKQQYSSFVKEPAVFVRPIAYRSVRVYIGGEISRPGYYSLSKSDGSAASTEAAIPDIKLIDSDPSRIPSASLADKPSSFSNEGRWPTLFDAIRISGGVTPNSDLTKVKVTRKRALGAGGGKVQAQIDFLKFVTDGDESVNIRLFDGDTITVTRSPYVVRDQLLAATKTNLSPEFIEVFVSGQVRAPGARNLPQGATLNQAIASAGGTKLLKGGIEFLRFNSDGSTDRRSFSYKASARPNDPKNPILMSGDIIRVNDSIISASVQVLNEITGPAVGIYSVYSLFKP